MISLACKFSDPLEMCAAQTLAFSGAPAAASACPSARPSLLSLSLFLIEGGLGPTWPPALARCSLSLSLSLSRPLARPLAHLLTPSLARRKANIHVAL